MYRKRLGGAAAFSTLRLALVATICFGFAGCHRKTPPPIREFVHIDPLLPLHPLWPNTSEIANADGALNVAIGESAAVRPIALPSAPGLLQPTGIPANLAAERRARIADDARRRVARLTQELRSRNDAALEAEARAQQKSLDARLVAAKTQSDAGLPATLKRISAPYDSKLYLLGFREVDFTSQTRDSNGQTLIDAQNELNAVRAEKERATAERDTKLAEARASATKDLDAERERIRQEFAQRLAKRRAELQAVADRLIERENGSLKAGIEPVPPIGEALASARARTLPNVEAPNGPSVEAGLARSRGDVAYAVQRQRERNDALRQRLIDTIRTNVEEAVEQIGRERHWIIVPEGTPGAVAAPAAEFDIIANELKSRWRKQSNP